MRPEVRHLIMKRMKNDHRDTNDFADARSSHVDAAYRDGYDDGYEDGRRGVKGTGRKRDRTSHDMNDFDDEEDFGKSLKLPRKVKEHWLHKLKDKYGNTGPRFSREEIAEVADKMRIDYDDYSPSDLYLMANVLYSDCTVFRQLTPKEKEAYYWVAAAQEWLEDEDAGLTGSEKVVSYYYNVANG